MASVAANIPAIPAQLPGQAATGITNAANASPATALDALFAALLANQAQGTAPDQITFPPANDAASVAADPSAVTQGLPLQSVLPSSLAADLPGKANKGIQNKGSEPANTPNKEQPDSQTNMPAETAADAAVLALLAQQGQQPQQIVQSAANTVIDAVSTESPPAPEVAANTAAPQAKDVPANPAIDPNVDTPEEQAEATPEDQAKTTASDPASKHVPVKGEKSQSAKEFSPALAALQAPRSEAGTEHSRVTQDQPQTVASIQDNQDPSAQSQADDRQPRQQKDHGIETATLQRTETPTLSNSHASSASAQSATRPDGAQPQNFAPAAAGAIQSAPQPQNTAATLHTVSTLRDVLPTPDVRSMAVEIASFADEGAKHFEIRMDPAELGRVDVHLTLDDAGKAQASLVVEKPHALEMLQKDSSGLERALKDAGIDLSNNGLNFSLKSQERQDNASRTPARQRNLRATAAIEAAGPSTVNLPSGQAGLDIRV